jgi:hypothetical protein
MPFIKNISLKRRKSAAGSAPAITFSIVGTATGSAGYFTSSNNRIYTGATQFYPIYITLSTASLVGGTPPYICKWTASYGNAPPRDYGMGDNTGSITVETYSYESDRWIATITDSSTPPNVVSSSIDLIVYGEDQGIVVGNYQGVTGNDNQTFNPLIFPGGPDAPLATINAAIRYAVPDNTFIYVASGTYAENPVINKKIYQIDASIDGVTSASLGSGNYFIYATKEFGTSSLRDLNTLSGFSSSVFNTIGVSPSGSIQQALFDIEPSGTIKVLAGVHEISTPISMSLGVNKTRITIDGETVPTGSGNSYIYSPQSILRLTNANIPLFLDAGPDTPNANNSASMHKISNLALEIYTGSFYSNGGTANKRMYSEMIRFRTISASVAYDMLTNNMNTTDTMQSNTVGSTTHPTERNISRHIIIGIHDSFVFGPYSPFAIGNIESGSTNDNPRHMAVFEVAANAFANPVSQSRIANVYNTPRLVYGIPNTISNLNLNTRRPTYARNNSNYGGRSYAKFDGIDEYLETYSFDVFTPNQTGSCYGLCVFGINTTNGVDNRIIWKFGDGDTGFSVVLTGSRVAINFYATSSGVSSNATMIGNVSNGQQYMSEFFFDNQSTNKRVGMALYDTSSLVTSSYFSSTQFTSDKFYHGRVSGDFYGSMTVGALSGDYRHDNVKYLFDDLGGSRVLWFDGTWTTSVLLLGTTGSASNPRLNKRQLEMYNWARYKYFSTSSIVTRSISASN